MKKKTAFAFSLSLVLLIGCSSIDSSSSSKEEMSQESSDISSMAESSVQDEDDRIMDRNDGSALEVQEVAYPYLKGSSTNATSYDYDNIIVNTPKNSLRDDFAFGVDCSSLYEVERFGGRFYDEEGKEEDLFKILKDGGANYARFRLWVDPHSASGEAYGGGTNDISTDIYLAKRALEAGLKVLIDFHYSDSWADPSKQWAPKAWMSLDKKGNPSINARTQYKRVGDYTGKALNAFKNAGVEVSAVQIGNETNNGMAGTDNAISKYFADMIASGVATAKSVFPGIKTIVHLANVNNPNGVYQVYDNLKRRDVDWDICGLSYYPYWHGGKDNLLEVMNECVTRYQKDVMIVETSWGFTDEGATFARNQFSTEACGEEGGYVTSAQGQATELGDLVSLLSEVKENKGAGLFYWEPAWLPINGSGWISKSGAYYNDNGRDYSKASDLAGYSDVYCYSSWANQAWFDYSGKALPSYKTYKHILDGDKTKEVEITGLFNDSLSATYNLSDNSSSIPTTAKVLTNVGSYLDKEIEWDEEELSSLKNKEQGHFTLHGTIASFPITCDVLVYYNYVQDNSFEGQNTLQAGNANEYAVTSPWNLVSKASGVRIESKGEGNRTGKKYFHWWSSNSFTFDLSQTLENVPSGTYALSCYVKTHTPSEYGGYNDISLYYQIGNGDKANVSQKNKCLGYAAGFTEWIIPSIAVTETSKIKIGVEADCGATTWGHLDDMSFVRVE